MNISHAGTRNQAIHNSQSSNRSTDRPTRQASFEALEPRQFLSAGTGLTPTISSFKVPAAVVDGAKIHGSIGVKLTNSESTTEKDFTLNIYASTSPTLDVPADTLVTTVSKHTSLKAGKTASVNIPITKTPAGLPNDSYYLIVEAVDAAGNINTVPSPSTVDIAAPFVALSGTIAPKNFEFPSTTNAVLTVTNAGNIADDSYATITYGFSTDEAGLDPTGPTERVRLKLHVGPGKTTKSHVTGWKTIIGDLPIGTYQLTATIIDANDNTAKVVCFFLPLVVK